MKTLFTFFALLLAFSVTAQTTWTQPTLSNTTVTVSDGDIYADHRGCEFNYVNGRNTDITLQPDVPGSPVSVYFDQFAVEAGGPGCSYDYLIVYDGPSTSSPQIGKYCGTTLTG